MDKRYEEIIAEINELLEKRGIDEEELLSQISNYESQIEKLTKGLDEATKERNVKEYKKINAQIEDLKLEISMCRNKLQSIEDNVVMSDEEALDYKQRVFDIQEDVYEEKIVEFVELLQKLSDVGEEIIDHINNGNMIFAKFFPFVHGFKHTLGKSNKGYVYAQFPETNEKYKDFAIYVKKDIESPMFNVLTGINRTQEKPKFTI